MSATGQEQTDVLGPPYTMRTLALRPDDEGEVVATLVTRRAEQPTRRAVLHVHGFADYFFQTVAADWWVAQGYDFYALDLRKYGRSLREHQTANYVTDLTAYDEELALAYAAVTAEHDHVVMTAHSTGGLIVPLWLDRLRPREVVGVALNAPWLEMNNSLLVRTLGTRVIDVVGAVDPLRVIPRTVTGMYARSMHHEHDGEWDFDLRWKPLESFEVHAGWLRAIRRAHARLHRGLDLRMPVLVQSSARSAQEATLADAQSADIVLDVEQIRRWTPALGRHVTLAQTEGATHDVTLSPEPVRTEVFRELERWHTAYVDEAVVRGR
ncbi:MAG: ytpA [Nocardioidaceae bacterium]|nr:ytpA [Nocardioidaceae bacterium]